MRPGRCRFDAARGQEPRLVGFRAVVNQMNGLRSKTEYRVLTGVSYAF
jgi:hypothetical protein